MTAALHTNGLETGAAALGVLNYASEATEISEPAEGDELVMARNKRRKAGPRRLLPTSSPALTALGQPPPKGIPPPEDKVTGANPHAPHLSRHQHPATRQLYLLLPKPGSTKKNEVHHDRLSHVPLGVEEKDVERCSGG